jgi:hypothetical protein
MTPRDVVLAYPTWIITLGVTAVMTWALAQVPDLPIN